MDKNRIEPERSGDSQPQAARRARAQPGNHVGAQERAAVRFSRGLVPRLCGTAVYNAPAAIAARKIREA